MSDRCPSCAAAVRPSDPWCTLCFTSLLPAPAAASEPVAVPEPVPAVGVHAVAAVPGWVAAITTVDPLLTPLDEAPAAAPDRPTWACPTCSSTLPYDVLRCPTCGHAVLGSDDAMAALPQLLRGGVDGGNKVALIVSGLLGFALLFFLTLTLVGSLV